MFTRNARPSTAATPPKTHEFEVEPGQDSLTLPHGFSNPARVYLIDIRKRQWEVARAVPASFAERTRSHRHERGEEPAHLRGMPSHYIIEDRELKFWPVPAHRWKGAVELPMPWVNPPDSA